MAAVHSSIPQVSLTLIGLLIIVATAQATFQWDQPGELQSLSEWSIKVRSEPTGIVEATILE